MVQLDERLSAIAALASQAVEGKEKARFADIGCDHGYLTAHMLQKHAHLYAIASDVSAPSLEKAKKLLTQKALSGRAMLAVADGLAAIDRPVDAIAIAGMGTQTILKIVRDGRERIANAALIVQSNVDLPVLRSGLAELGFRVEREVYTKAAGRYYVTMLAKADAAHTLDERSALLGTATDGAQDEVQRGYYLWQRGVRVREMGTTAIASGEQAKARHEKNSCELTMISEVLNMNTCSVSALEALVGGIAPFELAEEWDNVGLIVGRKGAQVTRVLVALDLTQAVIDEALALGAQAIVTHHPIMFSARKRVTDGDREGSLMLSLIENGIAHIAAHTNLDAAQGGVNDVLMSKLGATEVTGEGFVRIGRIEGSLTLDELAARAERSLRTRVRVYGAGDQRVSCLGCCSGAGSSEIAEAVAMGADCFITGEVKHNLALDAMDLGCCVIEAGHFETENPVCEVLAGALQNAADELKYNVTVFCSKVHPFGR